MRNKKGFGSVVLIIIVVMIVASSTLSVIAYLKPELSPVTEPVNTHDPIDKNVLDHVQENGFKGVPVTLAEGDREDLGKTKDSWDGLYSEGRNRIYINKDKLDDPDFNLMHTLWHEYGHYVWHKKLSETEKDEYRGIYESGSPSTRYGLEGGVHEDFAETYALFKLNKNIPHDKEWFMFQIET